MPTTITPISVYQVRIGVTTYTRSALTVTLNDGTSRLSISFNATPIITNAAFGDVEPAAPHVSFTSYADMKAWVLANVSYNIIAFEAVDADTVKINGSALDRTTITAVFDDDAETVQINDENYPDPISYDDIYPDGDTSPFASYEDMQEWIYNYMVAAYVDAVDVVYVKINDVARDRRVLTVELDSETGTVRVYQDDVDYIPTVQYQAVHIGSVASHSGGFASYAAMEAWFDTNVISHTITLQAVAVNRVKINEDTIHRSSLLVFFDSEAGTLTVKQSGSVLIDAALWSNLVVDDTAFSSYAAMVSWVEANVRFNGYNLDDGKDCLKINGFPYALNGFLTPIWDPVNETLEARYTHNDLSDKPMKPTHYSDIVKEDEQAGFDTYDDLIHYITNHWFYYGRD